MATSVNVAGVLTASYTRTLGYDAQARLSTVDHNGAATYAYRYGARGHRTAIRHGSTVLQAFEGTDAFGSSTGESFNGGAFGTARTFDAATGRLLAVETGPSATPKGIQDLEYKWREDGSLYRRIDRRGTAAIADDRTDTFTLDGQRRVERQATTGGAARTLDFGYDGHGNLTTKTSSAAGDLDAAAYAYGTAGKPHRLTRVTLDGVVNTLTYDANGNIAGYDAATGDDTAIAYDGQNRVESITVGTAKDEFWHGPDGGRFLRRETWTEDGAAKSKLTVYLGAYEEVRRSDATVKRVRASGSVVRVRVEPTSGAAAERFEYVHRDHLGSVDRVTDGTGAPVSTLSASSFDPFGGRRAADWSGDEPPATAANVLALQDERFSRGFTDHEGLHRTGFVHMNGRVYDPRIGRFLQPDPVVSAPATGQGHNRYAYVANAPLSATDPSGLMPVGGYVGRTGGVADYGALYGSLMTELWSAGGFETFNLSTFDAVIAKGFDNAELAEYMAGRWGYSRKRMFARRPSAEDVAYLRLAMAARHLTEEDEGSNMHGYKVKKVIDSKESGLQMSLFVKGRHAVVAARGTDELRDWIANGRQGTGFESKQYTEAMEMAESWAWHYDSIHFTGHSLGGGLAMAMAAHTGNYSAFTVFNSAGIHLNTAGGPAILAEMQKGRHIHSMWDPLQLVNSFTPGTVPGTRIRVSGRAGHSLAALCRILQC